MIKSISLRFFRKHEDITVNLTEGLQTLRGVNEAGKTTILEGAAYAMFGSKALRDSMAETVTWGHKESELSAEAVLKLDKVYTFKRSKAGAEVLIAGKVFVSGQNEVSAFAANLLGADVGVAHHLMLAGQGGLRGVLEQGPKATSNLIETLSDLDLIDRIVEAAQEKLTLGSTAVLEDRLKVAEQTLATTTAPVAPAEPDLVAQRATVARCTGELPAAVTAKSEAEAAFSAEFTKREQRALLERDREQLLTQVESTTLQLAAEKAKAADVVIDPAPLRAQIAAAEDHENRAQAFRTFGELVKTDMSFPLEAFNRLSTRVTNDVNAARQAITESKATIRALEPQVATTHLCPACGQDTAHLAAVQEKQAQLKASLAEAKAALAKAEAELPEADENIAEINALVDANQRNLKLANSIAAYVTIDEGRMPVAVAWNGEPVAGDTQANVAELRRQLTEIEDHIAARTKAEAKVEALREVLAGYTRRNAEITEQIAGLALADDEQYAALTAAVQTAGAIVAALEGDVALANIQIEVEEKAYTEALHYFQRDGEAYAALQESVKALLADIETTQFNNQLVKKVRAARPIIANKLWNLVLATVSTLFSQMRGEQSVVAKGKDGFTVNGRSVSSLSGSTLDILGLAIRCALVKTFIPNCPFLVLDEPSAACDDNRSASLIGFVASAGFKQVIMVTHSDMSEALSSNLIQL